jgi:hypothetical protein
MLSSVTAENIAVHRVPFGGGDFVYFLYYSYTQYDYYHHSCEM